MSLTTTIKKCLQKIIKLGILGIIVFIALLTALIFLINHFLVLPIIHIYYHSDDVSQSQVENSQADSSPTTEANTFASANDLSPSHPLMKQYNDTIKPILNKVFKGVKLTEYRSLNLTDQQGYILFTYVVKETISQKLLEDLRSEFVNAGYRDLSFSVNSEEFNLTLKNNKATLNITGSTNSHTIEFNILVASN